MKCLLFKLLLAISIFAFVCCSKKSQGNSNKKYFFKCQIDGRKIDISSDGNDEFAPNLIGEASYMLGVVANSTRCSEVGQYCFDFSCNVYQQKAGTYEPNLVTLTVKDGSDSYEYYLTNNVRDIGDMSVTINKITHGTSLNPGVMDGTFSGFIRLTSTLTTKEISGSFAVPIN